MKTRTKLALISLALSVFALVVYVPKHPTATRKSSDTLTALFREPDEAVRERSHTSRTMRALKPLAPATGDLVGTVTFSQDCSSGIGVGVAYDGAGHLWVSCYASNPDLLRASATTGVVDQTYNIKGGLGAVAYDATRNALWAGPGCATDGNVWLIQLDASKAVTGSSSQFTPSAGAVSCLDDGIGFDAGDDSIYYSADTSTTIGHYKASDGTLLGSFGWTGTGCYNSGLAIGGSLLFQGSDGCSHVWVVDKTTLAPAFDFSTVVAGDPNFRDEGLSCDTDTFSGIGKQVMWSKEAFSPNRASAFEIPTGTCGVGGQPPGGGKCPLSQGYWKNHPEAWPVTSLTIGGHTYTEAQLLNILNTPIGTGKSADASLILADQLIAALLDIANGSDPASINATIANAQSLLTGCNIPCGVKPSSALGQQMTAAAALLDQYNNKLLTPNCTP